MSEVCCKFQIPASNSVEEMRRQEQYYSVIWSNYVCHSRGHNSAIMTNQKSVSFMHMFNAYLKCVASFKSLHQIL